MPGVNSVSFVSNQVASFHCAHTGGGATCTPGRQMGAGADVARVLLSSGRSSTRPALWGTPGVSKVGCSGAAAGYGIILHFCWMQIGLDELNAEPTQLPWLCSVRPLQALSLAS